jgi:hypothetical protein
MRLSARKYIAGSPKRSQDHQYQPSAPASAQIKEHTISMEATIRPSTHPFRHTATNNPNWRLGIPLFITVVMDRGPNDLSAHWQLSSYNVKYPQGANVIATTGSSTRRQLPTTGRHSREFQGPAQRGFRSSFIYHSIALLSLLFHPARPHDLLLWPHGCALDGWLVLVITMECVHLWHRSIESFKDQLHRRAGRSLEQ